MESVIPVSEVDVRRTRELVDLFRTGSLPEVNIQDIPSFACNSPSIPSNQVTRFIEATPWTKISEKKYLTLSSDFHP